MRAGRRRHRARVAARNAAETKRFRERWEANECIARMEALAAEERGDGLLLAASYDELKRRFPGVELATPVVYVNGEQLSLREAADRGHVFIRGDGKIMLRTLKETSRSSIAILAAAVKK